MSYGHEGPRRGGMPAATATRNNTLAPGKRTLTESLLPQTRVSTTASGPEHERASSTDAESRTHAGESEHGAAERDAPREIDYPHRAQIEGATGIAIPGRAVIDREACEVRGVLAFADGDVAYFARSTPDLHVAAHEAVHLMQHAGLTGDAGLGAEQHAHDVADAIAANETPEPLLGHGATVTPAIRDYTVLSASEQADTGHWNIGKRAKVGDQGRTVTPVEQTHEAYADPALIVEANRILKAKKSGVELEPGGPGPSGPAPDGSGVKSTVQINYKIIGDPKDNEQYPHDCGRAARETMGEAGKDTTPRAIYKGDDGSRRQTRKSTDPADFRDEIYVATGLGRTPAEARAAYDAMTSAQRDAYDKKHGINRYAAPGVGEAFTRRRADHLITDWRTAGYNFHWGGVIMVAGDDRVTFENYVDPDADKDHPKNAEWFFSTYGPPTKAGQTWHEQWAPEVGGTERRGTTVAAASSADPSPFTTAAAGMTTADLIRRISVATDPGEKMALTSELGSRKLEVIVQVVNAQEGTDNVYVKARAGKSFQTGELKMRAGQRHIFQIPLSALLPITEQIAVEVRDADFGPDDTISNLVFASPYAPRSDKRPWDGAEYHTTVRFDR